MEKLISELLQLDITLAPRGTSLEIRDPGNRLTEALLGRIKEKKQEILSLLAAVTVQPASVAIPRAAHAERYRASSAQERLYFLYALDPASTVYNIPEAVHLKGPLHTGRLQDAFTQLLQRHEILRTTFELSEGVLYQRIAEKNGFKMETLQIGPDDTYENRVRRQMRPFDLATGPLFRAFLLQRDTNDHLLVTDVHHIVSDGVSQALLIHELITLYNGGKLPELPVQYKDFAAWQLSAPQQEKLQGHRTFWLNEYETPVPDLQLPVDFSRPSVKSYAGAVVDFELEERLTQQLKQLSESSGVTMHMLVMTLYAVLLGKLSGQEDVVIGMPVAGREHYDLQGIVGMFVNSLPCRCAVPGDSSFAGCLSQMKNKLLACLEHQSYPYEVLVDELKPARNAGRNPLFDVMFSMQHASDDMPGIPGITIAPFRYAQPLSKFDLSLTVMERDGRLLCSFEYCTELLTSTTVQQWAAGFRNIAVAVTGNSNLLLHEINMMSPAEREQVLTGFNQTSCPYPHTQTLVSRLRQQADLMPDTVGVIAGQRSLSYRQIWELAAKTAGFLQTSTGVGHGDYCAVMMEREEMLLPVIFGILMTGAAYVPVDPAAPEQRITGILQDAAPVAVITRGQRSVPDGIRLIDLDLVLEDILQHPADVNPDIPAAQDTAYVIYTSGSTGKPKGVMVAHQAVINYLTWMQKTYPLAAGDVILQKTPLIFDVSVRELFWWMMAGATLCLLPPGGEKDPHLLLETIAANRISLIHFVPSMLDAFLSVLAHESRLTGMETLRYVFCSGEALLPRQVEQFRKLLHPLAGCRLVNLYGPTETTVEVTAFECPMDRELRMVPIGKPIDNTRLYVLDRWLQPVPAGTPGELHIAGEGLAIGYVGNPSLTSEKFIDFMPSPHSRERIYKTGDLARWLPSGDIEFLGRIDQQVKLRGYRIEPGEIEHALLQHTAVKAVAVILVNVDDNACLAAYYVADNGLPDLSDFLAGKLPHYMIPACFIQLAQLPLTASGKLDRNALPLPVFGTTSAHVAPEGETARMLAHIWAEVLQIPVDSISAKDHFFERGGHSLRAVYLVNKLRERTGIQLRLGELFNHLTLQQMAAWVSSHESTVPDMPLVRVPEAALYRCSSAQERFYFSYLLLPENLLHNITCVYRIAVVPDWQQLQHAFDGLIARHEILRTGFIQADGIVYQQVHAPVSLPLIQLHIKDFPSAEAALLAFRRPFDLAKAPLIRCAVLQMNDHELLLMVDLHHIICDGVSLNQLMNEFKSLYEGHTLPAPEWRYMDYAAWQQQAGTQSDRTYWETQLAGELPFMDLPVLQDRQKTAIGPAAACMLVLPETLLPALQRFNIETGNTAFVTLLAPFYILVSKITGLTDIIIGTDAIGRVSPVLHHIIGSFVNILPLRVAVNASDSFRQLTASLRQCTLDGLEHQAFQFDEMVKLTAATADRPLVSLHFSMNNTMERSDSPATGIFVPETLSIPVTTQYELKIEVRQEPDKITVAFIYSTDLYDEATIAYFRDYYGRILEQGLQQPALSIEQF